MKKRWGKVFDLVGIEPGFMGGHQDAVVCLKKTNTAVMEARSQAGGSLESSDLCSAPLSIT